MVPDVGNLWVEKRNSTSNFPEPTYLEKPRSASRTEHHPQFSKVKQVNLYLSVKQKIRNTSYTSF